MSLISAVADITSFNQCMPRKHVSPKYKIRLHPLGTVYMLTMERYIYIPKAVKRLLSKLLIVKTTAL